MVCGWEKSYLLSYVMDDDDDDHGVCYQGIMCISAISSFLCGRFH